MHFFCLFIGMSFQLRAFRCVCTVCFLEVLQMGKQAFVLFLYLKWISKWVNINWAVCFVHMYLLNGWPVHWVQLFFVLASSYYNKIPENILLAHIQISFMVSYSCEERLALRCFMMAVNELIETGLRWFLWGLISLVSHIESFIVVTVGVH